MRNTTLPLHPLTGVRALGWGRRGPIWPVLGGSEDSGHPSGDPDGKQPEDVKPDQKPTETVDDLRAALSKSKEFARTWEKRAKDNAGAAKELAEIKDAQKTDAEKVADALANAKAEVDAIPAKVAEALRAHLRGLHPDITDEQAELYLTATDPELLLKQATGLVGVGKRKSNHVPREGRNHKTTDDELETFARQLFGGE
ncbi:hypothetical protein [Nocardia sp. NPDC059239]|uniref:hypothetical protein n=1 Tax=unclassified Nocardia TaxID=2637762 RepID=UPI0036C8294F